MAKPSLWQVICSVAASAIGVQSSANYERDAQSSNPLPYILVGIVFVVLFIGLLLCWVQAMLA